jgi:hypothetical protein
MTTRMMDLKVRSVVVAAVGLVVQTRLADEAEE